MNTTSADDLGNLRGWSVQLKPASYHRLEFRTRGNAITLCESRPSRVPSIERWLRIPMLQFRFDPEQGSWTLYEADPNRRWFAWDPVQPSPDLTELPKHVRVSAAGISVG